MSKFYSKDKMNWRLGDAFDAIIDLDLKPNSAIYEGEGVKPSPKELAQLVKPKAVLECIQHARPDFELYPEAMYDLNDGPQWELRDLIAGWLKEHVMHLVVEQVHDSRLVVIDSTMVEFAEKHRRNGPFAEVE